MSPTAKAHSAAGGIGEVIRRARVLSGRTQEDVATELGYHQSKISRLESGTGTQDMDVLRAVAAVLDIPLGSLGLSSHTSADSRADDMHRRNFLAASVVALAAPAAPPSVGMELVQALLPGPLPASAPPQAQAALTARLSQARRLFYACRYAELEDALPSLIADLRQAQDAVHGGDPALAGLLATAYQTAVSLLLKLGDHGNAWLAVGRAMAEAERSGDPVVMASSVRVQAHVLARDRHTKPAITLIRHTADQLASSYDRRPPAYLAALGLMLLRGVTAASAGGDRATTAEFLAEAQEVAHYVELDAPDAWANFSPTNVALHSVSASVVLGDAGAALEAAQPLMRRRIPVPERRAALWVEAARAYSQQGRLAEGYKALRIAESCASEDIRRRPAVLELAGDMAARDRRGAIPELRRFCQELGVQV
ncbi:helix-turn-helix transcriptional regulator [Kitasatospora sp. GP82]|uniref:helix-turn-helix domain-containing protein n=1 Tax=Kitasatospora sp. GP82 TaxID=3035089 RepID=UPI002474B9F5|nr:helix-turn-helix transcriptional regulator [Kitasatospora sp. GP82]MDH6123185.1 transcriptional regulator with XRE-family HTH domain [Kitasatospora sp. GP82]